MSFTAIIQVLLVISLCVLAILGVLYIYPIIQICGNSMYPTMYDGEFYVGRRVFRKNKCELGEIYVFRPPYSNRNERFVVKRLHQIEVDKVTGKKKYYFLGDNSAESYDSRYYGFVDSSNVIAHVEQKRGVK